MAKKIKELAELVGAKIIGNEDLLIEGAASLDNVTHNSIVFVENDRFLQRALTSPASAIVTPIEAQNSDKTLIVVKNAKLAFAKIINALTAKPAAPATIHATAIIEQSAIIWPDVSIGAHTVIGSGTHILPRAKVGANCSIGNDVEIGKDVVIHANVTIYDRVKIRDRVIIHSGSVIGGDGFGYIFDNGQFHKFPQIGDVIIEEDVEIGTNVSIDRGALDSTIIGHGTKIDNLCQIAHNVKIGSNCVLAAQVGVSGSSVIEDNVIVGGQVGIADHVRIEKGAIIGAQAGIPTGKIIRKGLTVWGTPARPIDDFKNIYAHTQNLPALKKRLISLEKRLDEKELAQAKKSPENSNEPTE